MTTTSRRRRLKRRPTSSVDRQKRRTNLRRRTLRASIPATGVGERLPHYNRHTSPLPSPLRTLFIGALGGLVCACATNDPAAGSRGTLPADVAEYVRLAAALGARDADSLDYSYAPPEW